MKKDLKTMPLDALKEELLTLKERSKKALNREKKCYLLVRQLSVSLEILDRQRGNSLTFLVE